jgi:hypothetical protein
MTCATVTIGDVEAKIKALLATVDEDTPVNFRPGDIS